MKAWVVARQELRERRMLWLVALVAGLTAFGAPWLRGLRGVALVDGRMSTVLGLGLGLEVVVALMLGAGLLAGDVAEGRLGFYLARPLSPGALFGGKLLGAVLMALGGTAVVFLPSTLAHPGVLADPRALEPLAVVALLGVLGAHAASVAFLDRSPWLLLDLAVMFGGAVLGVDTLLTCVSMGIPEALPGLTRLLIWGTILGLGLGGYLQVARGRTDLKRGHRLLSLALAATLSLTLGGARAALSRLMHVRGEAWSHVDSFQPAPQGPWVLARTLATLQREGRCVLFNTETREGLRLSCQEFAFSNDGRRAAWVTFGSLWKGGRPEVRIAELGSGGLDWRFTGIQVREGMKELALSADGRRGGLFLDGGMEIHDVDRGTLVARHGMERAPLGGWHQMVFRDPDHLRLYQDQSPSGGGDVAILELEGTSSRLTRLGTLRSVEGPIRLLGRDGAHESLLVRSGPSGLQELCVHDARSGALRFRLLPPGPANGARMLANGNLVSTSPEAQGHRIRLTDAEGRELGSLFLPGRPGASKLEGLRVGGETATGRVLLERVPGQLLELDTNVPGLSVKEWGPGEVLWPHKTLESPVHPGHPGTFIGLQEGALVLRGAEGGTRILTGPRHS